MTENMLAGLRLYKTHNRQIVESLFAIGSNMNKAMNIDCLKLIAFALEIKNDYGFGAALICG